MNYQYLAIAGASLSVVLMLSLVYLWVKVSRLEKLRKEFFADEQTSTIDQTIVKHNQDIKQLQENLNELGQFVTSLANANKKNFQKIGFIRFNPYGDTGGSISFVLALLDADDNGIVISSLHSREGNRVYAKEVKKKLSKSQLTQEETAAINQAN